MSSVNSDCFTSSLPIWMLVSFVCISVVRLPVLCYRSGKSEHHCFVPDFREKAYSLLNMMFIVGLS